ncbi:MAG TPA: DNA ligase D [Bryobacteraceae bacterium]|nr:DNA ligase D [Bryobacteraceae bacterium]
MKRGQGFMALEEYVRKRQFEKTPEPRGHAQAGRAAEGAAPHFYVQRHDATRLHYDFRLEIAGVLVSWAVPKGPSLEPLAKHLAAKVEDHPFEYGEFEGNIPAGNYGAGSVMLWDSGTWELLGDLPVEQQLARGDLKFRLHGEKLKGEFALVLMKNRGKGNEWLLIKKRDADAVEGWDIEQYAWSVLSGRTQQEIAQGLPARKTKRKTAGDPQREWKSKPAARPAKTVVKAAPPGKSKAAVDPSALPGAVKAAMPTAITPMKAALSDTPPRGDEWLFEIKWDGVRAICFIDHESIRLVSRTGHSCEKQYPELTVIPHYIAGSQAILDGEIAALDDKGVARFELIQPRIAQSDANAVSHMARSRPVVYFAFDLLYLNGYDLRQVPLAQRKLLLESILKPTGVLRYSEHFAGAGEQMMHAARETGVEGLMAKRADSRYESRRSSDWIKLKIVQRQEFVICGFTAGERDHFGALVLGVYDKGKLTWAGNVGTGFDQKALAFLRRELDPLTAKHSPFSDSPKVGKDVTWVKPELVAEVKFANWTGEGRLRAPVYLGLRTDVNPRDCVRERAEQAEQAASPSREALLPDASNEVTLTIDAHPLKFTNLNKVFYPAEGIVKRDLLNYYDAIADLILPHLKDRPLSLKRYPNGIEQQFFFQKDAPLTFAPWLRAEEIYSDHGSDSNGAPIRYVFAEDRASLLYLVNLGCIDHNPWMSHSPTLDNPDFVLIDLDPQDCPFDLIVEAALLVRDRLQAIGLKGYPKTTGGDGMHVYIPLEPVYSYEESRTFAEILAHLVQRDRPELFTAPRAVSKRQKGRVYFDWIQNGKSKTIAAPYVLRAYPGAPVATPLDWSEVKPGLTPQQFNIHNAPERFAQKGDLFAGVLHDLQRIEEPLQELEKLLRRPATSPEGYTGRATASRGKTTGSPRS